MALLTEQEMILRGRAALGSRNKFESLEKLAASTESFAADTIMSRDIFLSHSYLDKEAVYGVKNLFEELGYSVFVDWLEEELTDRENVDADTARQLRQQIRNCRCLLYATSSNSGDSKWMPWECGYADGAVGYVAITPIVPTGTTRFDGQEYLGIYPYLDRLGPDGSLFVNGPDGGFRTFDQWLEDGNPW